MKTAAKISLLSLLFLSATILFLSPPPALTEVPEVPSEGKSQFTLKLAAVAPDGTSWSDAGLKFKQYVEEKTGGRVRVIWYLGGIMGDEPDVFLKTRLGYLQGGGFTSGGLATMAPEAQILSLPFLFRNNQEIDYVLEKLNPHFQKIFEKKGFSLVGWLEAGRHYWFTQTPVKTIEDFQTCRMWAWKADPVLAETHRALGCRLSFANFPQVLATLHSGAMDAFYCPLYAAVSVQWYTQAKYLIDLPFSYAPAAIAMDKKFLDDLPGQFRDVIFEGWNLYLPPLKETIRRDNRKALEGLLQHGIERIELSPETVQDLKEMTHSIYTMFVDKIYPSWLLSGVLRTLSEYRRENPEAE